MDDCDFCNEFGASVHKISSRLVDRVGEIAVFTSLGAIVPGHLLFAPVYHLTASIALRRNEVEDLFSLVGKWSRLGLAEFGEAPIIFEHGDPTGEEVAYGQCVSHAHVHLLPRYVEMLRIVSAECEHIATFRASELFSCVDRPYLMISQDGKSFHFFAAAGSQRAYLRALYARLVGEPERSEWFRFALMDEAVSDAQRWSAVKAKYHAQ